MLIIFKDISATTSIAQIDQKLEKAFSKPETRFVIAYNWDYAAKQPCPEISDLHYKLHSFVSSGLFWCVTQLR